MTDKIQQARRELFEAWTKSEHGNISRRQDGEYFDDLTHGAWLGFNAALDCVVIELPAIESLAECPTSSSDYDEGFINGQTLMKNACATSIYSLCLGLRVK